MTSRFNSSVELEHRRTVADHGVELEAAKASEQDGMSGDGAIRALLYENIGYYYGFDADSHL